MLLLFCMAQDKFFLEKSVCRGIIYKNGLVAQLGERTVRIRKAEGSTPFGSTNKETSFVYQDKRGFCTFGNKRTLNFSKYR